MAGPKVSICIPAYKQPDYLRRTLQSIVMQTCTDYEIIVTDDSPDDSVEMVIRDFHPNSKLRYYRNTLRNGSPENWNVAIKLATGSYIKILHHDDWFTEKDSLSKFVSILDDNGDVDFAFSSTYACDQFQKIKYLHRPTVDQLDKLRRNSLILFSGNFIGAPSTTIFRNSAFVEFDQNLKWVVDIDFYINLLKKNPKFLFISEPLTCTTSGSPHQVTSECLGNMKIELYEYIYLYCKLKKKYFTTYDMFRLIGNLIKRYEVHSVAVLTRCGVNFPIPMSIKSLIVLQKFLH